MLINPIYLDQKALTGYIAAIEGGVLSSATETQEGGSAVRGGGKFGPLGAEGEKSNSRSSAAEYTDHDVARLQRLIDAATERASELDWIHVSGPDVASDLERSVVGSFVQWECDVYIPDTVKALQSQGGLADALETFDRLAPFAEALGLDTESDMPSRGQLDAFRSFSKHITVPLVVVGDDYDGDSDWKVAGTLRTEFLSDAEALDGPSIVVGKVRKIVRPNRWHPLLTLPGMNLMGRDERRKKEREVPRTEEEKKDYLEGPALVLDVLAIYR